MEVKAELVAQENLDCQLLAQVQVLQELMLVQLLVPMAKVVLLFLEVLEKEKYQLALVILVQMVILELME